MTPSVPVGELRRLGDRAFLIGVADPAAGRALAGELTAAMAEPGEVEVVCGSATVMVAATDRRRSSRGRRPPRAGCATARATRLDRRRRGRTGRLVTIPCRFDGPDLDEVAALAGCRRTRWWHS